MLDLCCHVYTVRNCACITNTNTSMNERYDALTDNYGIRAYTEQRNYDAHAGEKTSWFLKRVLLAGACAGQRRRSAGRDGGAHAVR